MGTSDEVRNIAKRAVPAGGGTPGEEERIREGVRALCARAASLRTVMQGLSTETKRAVLREGAARLIAGKDALLAANAADMARADASGMPDSLKDRLALTEKRIEAMAEGLVQVSSLEDPVGRELECFTRPNGMRIRKVSVPMGVIGIIYESRPNVTADAFALCFMAGSAVVLKGGSDAIESNKAIAEILRGAIADAGIPTDALQLITETDRRAAQAFMQMRGLVDLLIPRGGAGLIRAVMEGSRIPVIETGVGNCHIYVDRTADLDMAMNILINAKTQRIGVCNAAESLVVHEDAADAFLPMLAETMREKGVELRADDLSIGRLPGAVPATEEDFGTEYLAMILSVKIVSSLDEAIAHINRYHTGHSDCIVTQDDAAAERFLREIDSACVYHNVSTRFTDGFEFGFGAEIGISTQKLHARGPMGLRELTSYKYIVDGCGQVRG